MERLELLAIHIHIHITTVMLNCFVKYNYIYILEVAYSKLNLGATSYNVIYCFCEEESQEASRVASLLVELCPLLLTCALCSCLLNCQSTANQISKSLIEAGVMTKR